MVLTRHWLKPFLKWMTDRQIAECIVAVLALAVKQQIHQIKQVKALKKHLQLEAIHVHRDMMRGTRTER